MQHIAQCGACKSARMDPHGSEICADRSTGPNLLYTCLNAKSNISCHSRVFDYSLFDHCKEFSQWSNFHVKGIAKTFCSYNLFLFQALALIFCPKQERGYTMFFLFRNNYGEHRVVPFGSKRTKGPSVKMPKRGFSYHYNFAHDFYTMHFDFFERCSRWSQQHAYSCACERVVVFASVSRVRAVFHFGHSHFRGIGI